MTTDRELLEWAAKAAGFSEIEWQDMSGWGEVRYGMSEGIWNGNDYWNPLVDDGDALRTAVKLGLRVYIYPGAGDDFTMVAGDELTNTVSVRESHGSDPYAATRLAIVRAAASIGQQKEQT